MSFITDFKTIIEADPSINSMIPVSRIKHSHLPIDWELHNSWLAWDFVAANQENCLNGNNCFTTYTLNITITFNDTLKLDTASRYVIDYLNSIYNQQNFIDIAFTGDAKQVTLDKTKNLYQNTLTFVCIHIRK